jgi:Domain of unknown function (DUF6794)
VKTALLILLLSFSAQTAYSQAIGSNVNIVTVHSQNRNFYLKSIPFDNEFPTLRGKTYVYRSGSQKPLYVFDRGFDSAEEDSNNLILSNNGEVIFYAIPWGANEVLEGLKSITVYRHGQILRSYSEEEINRCDKKKERCTLLYTSDDRIIDQEKSNWGTRNYSKVFRDGVSETEKFLSNFPIFSSDDTVYLIDSKKKVHTFDLRDGSYLRSDNFDDVFDQIKAKGRFSQTELISYDIHVYLEFPRLKDGRNPYQSLAAHLQMKSADLAQAKDAKYKLYSFNISVDISRDGTVAVENIEVDEGLPKEKILEFFRANKFNINEIPIAFEKWHLDGEYFSFRNANDRIARQEKQQQIGEVRKERENRMTLETINGVYIPKDLGECFTELDRLLPEVDRNEMRALPRREEMIAYHLSLGMWMRNNWGLHGGSRLYKYFFDRNLRNPEDISSVVLFYYYDWLTGRTDTWKEWEKNPKRPFAEPADQRFANTINSVPKP